jgi:hypothetical protein
MEGLETMALPLQAPTRTSAEPCVAPPCPLFPPVQLGSTLGHIVGGDPAHDAAMATATAVIVLALYLASTQLPKLCGSVLIGTILSNLCGSGLTLSLTVVQRFRQTPLRRPPPRR